MKPEPKNILIIRFSAMGDVVLTVPVIQNLLKKYPNTQITILTKPFFHPFFSNIQNCNLFPIDLHGKHKGFWGLYRLVQELQQQKYDTVVDLHAVLRSWVVSSLLRLKGLPVFRIDKGRLEKKAFIKGKINRELTHTTQRYRDTLLQAGFDFTLKKNYLKPDKQNQIVALYFNNRTTRIGIAPFAAHKSKEWGLEKIQELIQIINKTHSVQFYLFGGGKQEVDKLNTLADKYNNVTNLAGKHTLQEEMSLLENLSVFIGMDSGNMHIASLLGIPVLSIWGGTHPDLGFKALYQPKENSIRAVENGNNCRPFSVYGKAASNCITKVTTSQVLARLIQLGIL